MCRHYSGRRCSWKRSTVERTWSNILNLDVEMIERHGRRVLPVCLTFESLVVSGKRCCRTTMMMITECGRNFEVPTEIWRDFHGWMFDWRARRRLDLQRSLSKHTATALMISTREETVTSIGNLLGSSIIMSCADMLTNFERIPSRNPRSILDGLDWRCNKLVNSILKLTLDLRVVWNTAQNELPYKDF